MSDCLSSRPPGYIDPSKWDNLERHLNSDIPVYVRWAIDQDTQGFKPCRLLDFRSGLARVETKSGGRLDVTKLGALLVAEFIKEPK